MSTPTTPSPGVQKQPRVLSCVLCQRRKIRCDRVIPCSNCIKANVTCTPSKPAPPRQRSRPKQDLQERLARCENLLRRYVDDPSSSSDATMPGASPAQMRPSGASHLPPGLQPSPSGRMVLDSENGRFVDGHLWSSLADEIQVMRDIIESEDPEGDIFAGREPSPEHLEPTPPTHPGRGLGFGIGVHIQNAVSGQPADTVTPLDPVQTFKMWQIFLERVNPLVKVIHAPTVQPYIVQAAGDMSSISANYQALLYSIFSLTAVALNQDEAVQLLNTTREQAVYRFINASTDALERYQFLRRYDMVVLQTLVHTLVVLQVQYNNRHTAWIFSGTLVRMALTMGYHHDGETLNLPPFETEMRRRIWWQILSHEMHLALSCGFKHNSIPRDFDTKPPLNLNDADLYPESTGELRSREGPTEMGFVVVHNRHTQYLMDEEARTVVEFIILGHGTPDKPLDPHTVERNLQLIDSMERDLMDMEEHILSPSAGPAHLAALGIRTTAIARLREMIRPIHEQPEWGTEIFGPRDNIFKVIVSTSENMSEAHDYMDSWGFCWFLRMHFHIEGVASLASQLYQRPMGALSDRGWAVLATIYEHHSDLYDLNQRIYAKQARFTAKAFEMREQAFATAGQPLEIPPFIVRLRQAMKSAGLVFSSTPSPATAAAAAAASSSSSAMPPLGQPNAQLAPDLNGDIDAFMPDPSWDYWADDTAPQPFPRFPF